MDFDGPLPTVDLIISRGLRREEVPHASGGLPGMF